MLGVFDTLCRFSVLSWGAVGSPVKPPISIIDVGTKGLRTSKMKTA